MPRGFIVKEKEAPPIAKMVIPGRRALGEQWQEVTIAVKDDKIQVTENVPTEAPPNGRAIFNLGMGQVSPDEVDFILEGARHAQEEEKRRPRRRPVTDAEIEAMVNRMWLDYVAQKLAWLKGQTTIGAGGFYQRQSPGIQNWTGVKR